MVNYARPVGRMQIPSIHDETNEELNLVKWCWKLNERVTKTRRDERRTENTVRTQTTWNNLNRYRPDDVARLARQISSARRLFVFTYLLTLLLPYFYPYTIVSRFIRLSCTRTFAIYPISYLAVLHTKRSLQHDSPLRGCCASAIIYTTDYNTTTTTCTYSNDYGLKPDLNRSVSIIIWSFVLNNIWSRLPVFNYFDLDLEIWLWILIPVLELDKFFF